MVGQWLLASLVCILLCVEKGHLYCIVPSQDQDCPCQRPCLTLSEISDNSTYYLERNGTLFLQPGNHSLDSKLSVQNISMFMMYSDNSSLTRIMCTQAGGLQLSEVTTIEISGLVFVGCAKISVVDTENCTFCDLVFVEMWSGNISVLEFNRATVTTVSNTSFMGVAMSVAENSFVTMDNVFMSDSRAALAVYDSSVDFMGLIKFTNNNGSLLAYNATLHFMGTTVFTNSFATDNVSIGSPIVSYLQNGGAISSFSSHLTFCGNTIFTENVAKYGGAVYAVDSNILFTSTQSHASQHVIADNSARESGGGIYLYRSIMTIKNSDCRIVDNRANTRGGGIHLVNSDVVVESDDMMLRGNSAQLGGGLYLVGTSRIQLYIVNSTLILTDNTADYGAALYIDDYTNYETCFANPDNSTPESECFLRVVDSKEVGSSLQADAISVHNNTAKYSGSNLFGGLLDRCQLASSFNLHYEIGRNSLINVPNMDGLTFLKYVSNISTTDICSISSHPVRICSCTDNVPNCNITSLNMEVEKGQQFTISVAPVDHAQNIVSGNIFSSVSSSQTIVSKGESTLFESKCMNLTYTLFSPHETEILSLYADGPCRDAQQSQLSVNLHFLPCNCPFGFDINQTYNGTSCECICDPLIFPQYISGCSLQPEPFIIRKTNSWIKYTKDRDSNGTIYTIGPICPFRYCLGETNIRVDTQDGITAQCIEGRNGTLCTRCATNYSYALSGKRCVRCPTYWPLTFLLIVIGALLAGVGLVTFIMALNFTVAVGTINGFIFYANIIDVYDMIFLPFNQPNFPEIVIEWLNLDPGIDVCFFPGYNSYHLSWVRLLFPLYIIFIVFVIIFISRHSIRFSTLIAKRNPVAVLATLILLSYANFLETALLMLTPSNVVTVASTGYREETVWLLNGDIAYLHRTHIPLFIVALFILILAIAYKLIIFSWQWVVRCPKGWLTNNQKLNSFIQTYQAPFCDRHRYWTGLLLLVRVFLTLYSSFTASSDPNSSVLAMILIFGLLFLLRMTYAKNLYKKWPVDLLDTVLLFNLFVLATMAYAYEDDNTRRILSYVSVSFMCILLLIVFAYHIYAYILVGVFPKLKREKYGITQNTSKEATTESNSRFIHNEDRFKEFFGVVELPDINVSSEPIKESRTRKSKTEETKIITHTEISLTDLLGDQEQTIIENNFHTPYKEATVTNEK